MIDDITWIGFQVGIGAIAAYFIMLALGMAGVPVGFLPVFILLISAAVVYRVAGYRDDA